jgi:hypothetical protein
MSVGRPGEASGELPVPRSTDLTRSHELGHAGNVGRHLTAGDGRRIAMAPAVALGERLTQIDRVAGDVPKRDLAATDPRPDQERCSGESAAASADPVGGVLASAFRRRWAEPAVGDSQPLRRRTGILHAVPD